MRHMKNTDSLICGLIIAFLSGSSIESTAQVKAMSAKELTQESSAVFYGRCSKIKSEWNDNKSAILTYVTIVPEAYIKGNLGSEAVITVPGGRVDDILYEVSEMPVFAEGEEVVAFVWTNPSGKNLVTGGYQGKVKINKDQNTGKRSVDVNESDLEGLTQVHGYDKPEKVALEDYVTKLKGYVKN
jgi:hypothetical protein